MRLFKGIKSWPHQKDPKPAKDVKLSESQLKAPSELQGRANNAQKNAEKSAEQPNKELDNSANLKLKPIQMDAKAEMSDNLGGSMQVKTDLPPELADFANADVEAQVRSIADKDLQPSLTKSLGSVQRPKPLKPTATRSTKDHRRHDERGGEGTTKGKQEQDGVLKDTKLKTKQAAEEAKGDIDGELKTMKKQSSKNSKGQRTPKAE